MSGVIDMGFAYSHGYESILMADKKTELARIWPFPGHVVFQFAPADYELTVAQATELAGYLLKAVEDAQHLHQVGEEAQLRDDRIAPQATT